MLLQTHGGEKCTRISNTIPCILPKTMLRMDYSKLQIPYNWDHSRDLCNNLVNTYRTQQLWQIFTELNACLRT